jgi:hypothetical protein
MKIMFLGFEDHLNVRSELAESPGEWGGEPCSETRAGGICQQGLACISASASYLYPTVID